MKSGDKLKLTTAAVLGAPLAVGVGEEAQAGVAPSGYVYSFNGPHSLFSDTIRSCRVLGLGHVLGHPLMGEGDRAVSKRRRARDLIQSSENA